MKKIQSLGKKISKEDQKKILGGEEQLPIIWTGYCLLPEVGCWHYTSAVYYATCMADIQVYCNNGGGCSTYRDFCPN